MGYVIEKCQLHASDRKASEYYSRPQSCEGCLELEITG